MFDFKHFGTSNNDLQAFLNYFIIIKNLIDENQYFSNKVII